MDERSVVLLDAAGQWTHRDRHQHHRFEIDVPERTLEIWIRFRWGPLDMGSEHEANGLSLSLFGPDGYRGGAMRSREGQEISIGAAAASLGCVSCGLVARRESRIIRSHLLHRSSRGGTPSPRPAGPWRL